MTSRQVLKRKCIAFQYLMQKKARQHLKIKYFAQTQRFLARLHAVGGCTQHQKHKSRFTFVRIKYFSKKIVKIENVNSFLENVSDEKKPTIDFADFLSIVPITILLLLRPIHQFKRIIKKKMKKRSDLHY